MLLDLALLTFICLFMVMQKSVMKYMTRIGQKTGMLKNSKKVQKKAITVALVAEYQNLNSGNRLKRIKQMRKSITSYYHSLRYTSYRLTVIYDCCYKNHHYYYKMQLQGSCSGTWI